MSLQQTNRDLFTTGDLSLFYRACRCIVARQFAQKPALTTYISSRSSTAFNELKYGRQRDTTSRIIVRSHPAA